MAQIDESKQFLYLQTGEVVYSNKITQTQGLFKDYLNIDNRRFELKDIKFINQGSGFYANTRGVLTKRKSIIAERIEKGAINVFAVEIVSTMRTNSGGSSTFHEKHYLINKGYDNLQKMNTRNLGPMVQGNNESIMELGKAKSYYNIELITSITGVTCFAVAFGVFFTGLAQSTNASPYDPNGGFDSKYLIIPGIAVGVGAILAFASNKLDRKRNKSLRKAIEIYNSANIPK